MYPITVDDGKCTFKGTECDFWGYLGANHKMDHFEGNEVMKRESVTFCDLLMSTCSSVIVKSVDEADKCHSSISIHEFIEYDPVLRTSWSIMQKSAFSLKKQEFSKKCVILHFHAEYRRFRKNSF